VRNESAVNSEAGQKVADLADVQKAYYAAKIVQQQQLHDKRMKVLELEERVLQYKLRKFGEEE
jgi:hypothetical protein